MEQEAYFRIEKRKKSYDELDIRGDMDCPYCGDTGFDRIGLKGHLSRYCEEYMNCSDH